MLLLASLAAMAGCYEPKFESGCGITCAPGTDDACPGDATCGTDRRCHFNNEVCEAPGLTGLVKITTGGQHACTISDVGELFCWGSNELGQIDGIVGNPVTTPKKVVKDEVASWTEVDAGAFHTCAIGVDRGGSSVLYCWGDNREEQCGKSVGDTTDPHLIPIDRPKTIAAGRSHSCATDEAGKLFCWGSNSLGQLGVNDSSVGSKDSTPKQVIGSVPNRQWLGVSLGSDTSCGVTEDHHVECWGNNLHGQLGRNSTDNVPTAHADPLPVFEAFGNPATSLILSVGQESLCAVEGSALVCWGDNESTEAAQAVNVSDVPKPIPALGTSTAFTKVAMGHDFGCAIDTAGHVSCWGEDADTRLGDRTTGPRGDVGPQLDLPVKLIDDTDLANVFAIDAGGYLGGNTDGFACALVQTPAGGKAVCWGANDHGQLGDGKPSIVRLPTAVLGDGNWAALRMKGHTACAIQTSDTGPSQKFGSTFCWGDNSGGVVDPDAMSTPFVDAPVVVADGADAYSIALGRHHACAMSNEGTNPLVKCWGDNTNNALGMPGGMRHVMPALGTPIPYLRLGSSDEATCVFTDEVVNAKCWGRATWIGPTALTAPGVIDPSGGSPVRGPLTMGTDSVCTLKSLGLTCRGAEPHGERGNGDPTTVATDETNVAVNAAGNVLLGPPNENVIGVAETDPSAHHRCAFTDVDTYCWGEQNGDGKLGTEIGNSTFARPVDIANPFHPRNPLNAQEQTIAVGGEFTCAVEDNTQQIFCWGDNDLSQCTDNGEANHGTPTPISDVVNGSTTKFVSVATGEATACGIAVDGQIYCWGSSRRGETGTGGSDHNFASDIAAPQP